MKSIAKEDGGTPNRRQFLAVCSAVVALPLVLGSTAAMAAVPSFTITDGNAKVDVYLTRNGAVRCTVSVRTTARSAWTTAGRGYHVLVRKRSASGRFDEETTDSNGDTRHSDTTYTAGTRVDVSVSGLVGGGSGAL